MKFFVSKANIPVAALNSSLYIWPSKFIIPNMICAKRI